MMNDLPELARKIARDLEEFKLRRSREGVVLRHLKTLQLMPEDFPQQQAELKEAVDKLRYLAIQMRDNQ